MGALIQTETQLQASVGKPAPARDVKVIDHLDAGAQRWLAASPILFATFAVGADVRVTLAGDGAGFASADGPKRLRIPRASLDEAEWAVPGRAFGGLFLVPGLGETLRVNGRVEAGGSGQASDCLVHVDECYIHCAKALIRSDFWCAAPLASAAGDAAAGVISQARFLALGSSDGAGNADLSPKGDPAGLLLQQVGEALVFADRPGNRRTDSFLNILAQPRIALMALVPGSTRCLRASGVAELSTDDAARAAFTVRDKVPTLVVRLADAQLDVRDSAALARARLWPAAPAPAGLVPSAVLADHVKAHKAQGPGDLVAKALVAVPGMLRKGLERDYDSNLY